jgi:hypothetical protein
VTESFDLLYRFPRAVTRSRESPRFRRLVAVTAVTCKCPLFYWCFQCRDADLRRTSAPRPGCLSSRPTATRSVTVAISSQKRVEKPGGMDPMMGAHPVVESRSVGQGLA